MQEDERLLSKGELSECGHQAVLLRLCEKRTLHYASEYARKSNAMIAQAIQNQTVVTPETRKTEDDPGQEESSGPVEKPEGKNVPVVVVTEADQLDSTSMTQVNHTDPGQEEASDHVEESTQHSIDVEPSQEDT